MMNKVLAAALFFGLLVGANTVSSAATVTGITVAEIWIGSPTYLRVVAKQDGELADLTSNCNLPYGFAVDGNDPNFKELYAALLMAQALNRQITIFFADPTRCIHSNNYVVVNHIRLLAPSQ